MHLMRMYARVVLAVCAIVLLAGCATQASAPGPRGEIPVHVVTHGWHTGLAMRASDIDFARWPALPHPVRARYIEVGWGDRDYYPAPGFNLWYAFKALLWPTASVLHVTGFDQPPRRYFPASEIVELHISRTGFERLLAYIAASFEPDAAPIAPSLYASGAFYPSREKFHLFKTCNVWVARGLREAGIEVRSSLTTEGLMAQLRPLGPPGHESGRTPFRQP
jgi:uncharacterized protein (TIGR02117 family)